MSSKEFSQLPLEQLYAQLQSSPAGLTDDLALKRIKNQPGKRQKESRFKKELKLLIRQFSNPLVLLLVIAVILSSILGESSDSIIILIILLTTGFLGFWQELNAGRAMEELVSLIQMNHLVLRNYRQLSLPAVDIVAGDIVLLDAGDIIPADCRIVESNELHVNESSITGESFPVEKQAGEVDEDTPLSKKYNCLWKGTNVISGTAKALVVATGEETIFGSMVQGLEQTPETAFEKGIRRFGFFLLRITITLAMIILIANLYFKKPLFDSVLFSLALAVGMAPELLPAIMTFAMSAGAKRMMKKKVIVKKLSSIFNFGEVNFLCTDKTGTITEGTVLVKDIVNSNGITNDRIRLFAFLNAKLQNGFTNPIDQALSSLNISADGYKKLQEIPYDFTRRRLTVAVQNKDQKILITKGAFPNVLEICTHIEFEEGKIMPLEAGTRTKLEEEFVRYSREGYRVLGLCYKSMQQERIDREEEKGMIFSGYILLEDPLKESTPASLDRLKALKIKVKIITGDNQYAAAQVAGQIGIKDPVILTGEEMRKLTPEALKVRARKTDIFTGIEPQQKESIIKALQKSAKTVAYIGDGINDVAAIHAADIGISTNNAVDVAKEAADFVLLEKDLSVLADGISEGRRSFANSMKYIFITTGATFGNMFSIAGASLFLPFLPMLPKQILLTNLISDLPFLTIASDHVDEEEMRSPGKWNLPMIRNFMIYFGLHSSIFDFITFYTLYHYFTLSGSAFQTGWFLESVITEILILFIIRTKKPVLRSMPGKWLMLTGGLAIAITIFLPFSPFAGMLGFLIPHMQMVMAIGLILIAYVLTADLLKIFFFRKYRRGK